jgi:hypothetical protein
MATPDSRREVIRRTLEVRAGGVLDSAALAEATIETWQLMAARLLPIVGTRGVEVLLLRSLHLTCVAFPWLDGSEVHGDSAALLASLKARLAGCEPESSAGASCRLLATFIELLITLIGESLAGQLMGPVWVPSSSESEKELTP